MAATTVTIQGDKEFTRKLLLFKTKIKNPKKALKDTGNMLVKNYVKNFETEGRTLGAKWKPLSTFTVAQKVRLGYGAKKILERTGKLMKSIKIVQLNTFLVKISSKLKYFKYHQSSRPRTKLPRRKMIDINTSLAKEVTKILRTYLFKGLTR